MVTVVVASFIVRLCVCVCKRENAKQMNTVCRERLTLLAAHLYALCTYLSGLKYSSWNWARLLVNVMKRRKKIRVFDTNRYKKATEDGAFAWRLSYFYSFWFSFHLNFLLLDFWFFWMFINSNQASPHLPTCKRLKVKSKSTKQQWRDTTQCYCYYYSHWKYHAIKVMHACLSLCVCGCIYYQLLST